MKIQSELWGNPIEGEINDLFATKLENLGTALKTVIARFSELKESEDELDDGGSANRVEKALASVGVQLRDTAGQFRDFDDVILDLSKKWDSLSVNQQRYIATQAAGSRLRRDDNREQLTA